MQAEAVLEAARQYLREVVTPRAQEIDSNPGALGEVLKGLCENNLMALKRPAEFGGPALSDPLFRLHQEEMAATSGALAFLATQHQSAVGMIAGGENRALAEEYLPLMADGQRLVGIGFSQLRRPGPPVMRATPTEDGYILDGDVPWITGFGFYPEFVIGAYLPDGRAVFGIVPLADTEDGAITITTPMRLAAMESANTVSATLKGYHMSAARTSFIRPAGWIRNNDMINVALQGHFALGCARAGVDLVRQNGVRKGFAFLVESADTLQAELEACRTATANAIAGANEQSTEAGLAARAWAIDLAVRCAHCAVAASSGAANSSSHPAQRIYREALVYTVSAQTTAIMEATIKRLGERASLSPT